MNDVQSAKTIRSLVVRFKRRTVAYLAAAQVLTSRRCRMTDDTLDRPLFLRSLRK